MVLQIEDDIDVQLTWKSEFVVNIANPTHRAIQANNAFSGTLSSGNYNPCDLNHGPVSSFRDVCHIESNPDASDISLVAFCWGRILILLSSQNMFTLVALNRI